MIATRVRIQEREEVHNDKLVSYHFVFSDRDIYEIIPFSKLYGMGCLRKVYQTF